MLSKVREIFLQLDNRVIFRMEFFGELLLDLFTHVSLHEVVVILQGSKFAICHIQLIDDLIALCTHLAIDDDVDVAQELLTLSAVIDDFHIFEIDHVPVLVTHDLRCLSTLPEILFTVLDRLLAEDGDAFVEIFHREDDTRSTGKCVYLRAPIPQSSQELLNKANFVHYVQMVQLVHIL